MPMSKISCPSCGVIFACDRDEDACWCQSLPRLSRSAIDPALNCLCQACLGQRIRQYQQAHANGAVSDVPETDPDSSASA